MKRVLGLIGAAWLSTSALSAPLTVTPVSTKAGAPLPIHIGGRVEPTADGYRRQWPGTYFEASFRGEGVLLKIGEGDVILRISVDATSAATLVKPKPGLYRVDGLANGRHTIRVDVASESQAASTVFGGFYATAGTRALPSPARTRQIEFIGDSHTVGYGNISAKRDCTQDEVWATTDTSQAMPALTARRYGADYQVNAISGRGIVRNYDGMPGDTVPAAYPFTLFDKAKRYADPAWHPSLYVIALGTNDFTTPLHPNEPWKTRDALHADYEQHYVAFVKRLRARDPNAHVVLWATDMADGEIASEVAKVAARLKAAGERNVTFVPVTGLAFTGCHAHPSTADDGRITTALSTYIDAHAEMWARK
ncbi:GDSL-like lipase/acylhydrolase family protein [Sphingomonas sp. PP-CE-3G-477]|uniref:SGNH/GDSL hydrolase family protein n=1 Tax=Sphingomonas sp. PP-CE-3G-477 TaxID=2135660 RepID=UPI000D356585|nr:SGNH/GDSL hydrolase family protein [Sphingomonas sp. PP-CE-3G-477]PTQ64681.1 GDSL-like lipase/acylhydrolase family protein [Sphingomonas sp. PP-CE-3G-477]